MSKKSKFEPSVTPPDTTGAQMGFATVVEYVEPVELTLDEREAELQLLTVALIDEREALEAAKLAHAADVAAFEASLLRRSDMPTTITLESDYGFIDNGTLRHWPAGRAITTPADIALLFAKKAPIEGFNHV